MDGASTGLKQRAEVFRLNRDLKRFYPRPSLDDIAKMKRLFTRKADPVRAQKIKAQKQARKTARLNKKTRR